MDGTYQSEVITLHAVCWMTTVRMKLPIPASLTWHHLLIYKEERDVALPDY